MVYNCITVFWLIRPCNLVGAYQCFSGTHCCHLQCWLLKVKVIRPSETSVSTYKIAWSLRPEDHILNMKITVILYVVACAEVGSYQFFWGRCLHYIMVEEYCADDGGRRFHQNAGNFFHRTAWSHASKTVLFIVIAVRTSNLIYLQMHCDWFVACWNIRYLHGCYTVVLQ
jgi:hypothetical protein